MTRHPAATETTAEHAATTALSAEGLAAEALRLAPVRPERARTLSAEAEQRGLADHNWAVVSVARRADGVAAIQLRVLDVAVQKLRGSVTAASRAQDRRLAGEANMSLAAALMLSGATRRAFGAIEAALSMLQDVPAARALSQRAAMYYEQGRLDEAFEDLRLALPILRRAGDAQWEVRALANRSPMFGIRRQFAAAEADLLRARQLSVQHSLTLSGAIVQQNLGCIYADRGDIAQALEHFDGASKDYRELGMTVGSLFLDRSRVLLAVRLLDEARSNVDAAVATFAAQHNTLKLPEAQLMLSTTALLQGDAETAGSAAAAAAAGFARLGRQPWLALARYARVQAEQLPSESGPGSTGRPTVRSPRLRRSAVELQATGWQVPALEARLLAARLALTEGHTRAAREDLAQAARMRRSGPADARARAWLAEGLLREAEGSRRGARSAFRAGLRVLADYRASLGATELRAHVSVHRGELARAGLRLALEDGNAKAVHWWSECGRASADLLRPVRPPQDSQLADHLQDLRATMSEIDQARGAGLTANRLVARQVELERAIRDRSRHALDGFVRDSVAPPLLADLAAALGDMVLVEYIELGGVLYSVTLADGRSRLHRLGPIDPVRHAVDHLPFALRRLARLGIKPAQQSSAIAVMQHMSAILEKHLMAPLAKVVDDRPLVILPVSWLQSVPWSVLPSCLGRPINVAPSAALWMLAASREPPPTGRVVAIAGPRLAKATEEALEVAKLYGGAQSLVGEAAVSTAVAEAMRGSRLAHVAAHGSVRSDNPLFSSLLLADGPFTVYDLEALGDSPHQVILAACNSALSHITAGEEILGLAAALLAQQTATLIAPVVPIPDAETMPLMTTFHRLVAAGRPLAAALAEAQERHRAQDVRAGVSAAGFICLGAG